MAGSIKLPWGTILARAIKASVTIAIALQPIIRELSFKISKSTAENCIGTRLRLSADKGRLDFKILI
jgi:hypothetical protein